MAEIVNMPKLGFDMAEGTLIRWVIAEEEAVEKGQVLAEIETDKATVEVESPFSGVVRRHLVEQDTIVPVSTPIAVIGESGEEIDFEALLAGLQELDSSQEELAAAEPVGEAVQVSPVAAEATSTDGASLPDGVRASPLARRMAGYLGINLSQVRGSGPGGRITKSDIETYQAAPPVSAGAQAPVFPCLFW